MALLHQATVAPTKAELIERWAPTQPWGPPAGEPLTVIGAFRFDDPDGEVGMETHLVRAAGTVMQIPLTYRGTPVEGAEAALIGEMQHSVLGTRWVYDGLGDALFVTMLAAVTMTGQGEALGMAVYDGRWHVAPANVRILGGGWTQERVPVDDFTAVSQSGNRAVLHNDHFELAVFRRPSPGPRRPIALTATWEGQTEPVVLAEFREK